MAINKFRFLKINRQIDVFSAKDGIAYKSLIQEIREDSFAIQEPIYKMSVLPLQPGQRVSLKISTEGDKYTFESQVLSLIKENKLVLYVLTVPENVVKQERRNFVRVEVAINVKYNILKEPPNDLGKLNSLQLSREALGIDLSGGGLMLVLKKPVPERQYIIMEFDVGTGGIPFRVRILGQVLRSITEERGRAIRHLAGVSFIEVDERLRDKIIAFVFDKIVKNIRRL